MRQADTDPSLAVYAIPHYGYWLVIELVVRNLGRTAARARRRSRTSTRSSGRCGR